MPNLIQASKFGALLFTEPLLMLNVRHDVITAAKPNSTFMDTTHKLHLISITLPIALQPSYTIVLIGECVTGMHAGGGANCGRLLRLRIKGHEEQQLLLLVLSLPILYISWACFCDIDFNTVDPHAMNAMGPALV